ncbi:MAG: hypothetical protein WC661_10645 [Opitutaceae bacterium]
MNKLVPSKPGVFRRWISVLLLILPLVSVHAGSLEFRSDGFFASPDAQVKFFRESWRTDVHLDVNDQFAVSFVGPILHPGYHTLSGAETRTEVDPARRQLTDSGVIGKLATPCRRILSEYKGGLLMRLEYGTPPAEITEAKVRLLFPVEIFANRRAQWSGGETVFPLSKPAPGRFFFVNAPNGEANQFRFDLGNGTELGVKFLSRIKNLSLSDCREWNEANYHLAASFEGRTMLVFLCVLKPQDPFPEVAAPPEPAAKPEARPVAQGAVFAALNGTREITVTKSGRIQVGRNGDASFAIEPPYTFSEPVSLDVKNNRVEIVTRVKDKPLRLRQTVTMEDDGWLGVSSVFEGGGDA